jgi:hypothetical protein
LPPLRRAAPADEAQRGTGAGRGPPMGPPEIITNVITAVLDEAAESQHRQRIEAAFFTDYTYRSTLSPHLNSTRFCVLGLNCAFRGTADTDGSVGFLIPQNHTQH